MTRTPVLVFFNGATRKISIIYVTCIILLLHRSGLKDEMLLILNRGWSNDKPERLAVSAMEIKSSIQAFSEQGLRPGSLKFSILTQSYLIDESIT